MKRRINDKIGRLYGAPLGDVARILLILVLAVFPVAHDFHYFESAWWLVGWAAVFGLREIFVWYLAGLGRHNLTKRLARINRDIGGNIDSLARKVLPTGASKNPAWLSETESHVVCMSLLARIHDFAVNEYPGTEPSDLRVTLAVPIMFPGMTRVTALRVWCYDRPHDDSQWTEFALPAMRGEAPLAGAPDAFLANDVRLIDDIRTTPGVQGVEHRRYRSILSIPVPGGRPGGKAAAVVNIDAAAPDFFDEDVVWERILPLSTPILSMISFVLRLRAPSTAYHFGN